MKLAVGTLALFCWGFAGAFRPPAVGRCARASGCRALFGKVKPAQEGDQREESAAGVPIELDLDFLSDDSEVGMGSTPEEIRSTIQEKAARLEETQWKGYEKDADSDLEVSDIDKLPFPAQLSEEFKLVKWPNQQQVTSTAVTVLALTLFMLAYFAVMRIGTRYVAEQLFGEFHDLDML